MTEPICKTCKHEGTDETPFCIEGGASICSDYEIHATKEEVAALKRDRDMARGGTLPQRRGKDIESIHRSIVGAKILAFELDVSHGPQTAMHACLRIEGWKTLLYDMDTGHITFNCPSPDSEGELDGGSK